MFNIITYTGSLRTEAEKLRDRGYSYAMITRALGVPKSTMSYWFRDRPFRPNKDVIKRIKYGPIRSGEIKHNKTVLETRQTIDKATVEIGRLSKRDIWMLGLGLYIGEGSKSIESVRIMNSDPAVIKIAIRWLKETCGLSDDNIVISLHLYPDNDVSQSIKYWKGITGLPRENFRKTQIDTRANKSSKNRGKLPHGTAHLRVIANGNKLNGVILFRRIKGWMNGALSQV